MKRGLDNIDRAIVDRLIEDGRMSCAEIARSLGSLSARSVSNRIDALIKEGIIKVTVVPRRTALGYPIIAGIGVEVETGRKREVAEMLARMDEVAYVGIVAGDSDVDIWIETQATGMTSLQAFVSDALHSLPGVRRTSGILLLTEELKDIDSLRIPAESP